MSIVMSNRERDFIEKSLKDKIICQACGTTLDQYARKCRAPLDVKCEGFIAIEHVRGQYTSPDSLD